MEKKGLNKKEADEIKNLIKPEEKIKKPVAIGWDGSNFTIRLPREIANYFKITEKNRFKKSILFEVKEKLDGTIKQTFEIIEREKPRRKKNRKNKRTTKKQ